MRNYFLSYIENIIMIKVKGKNIDHFLSYLYKSKINILNIYPIDRQEINIKIYERDLIRIESLKTSNEIEVVNYYGWLGFKKFLKRNIFLILSIILGYFLLLFLTNVIFSVQVIHNSKKMRNIVIEELKDYNVAKFHLKKSYQRLEQIEKQILNKYKDKIEWLEIEEVGTKYIVRVEERKIINNEEENIYQDIIASKNATIIRIEADSGVVLRKKNDYVRKGDIIISGSIYNGEKLTNIIKASGKIFGEVWYNIRVEFPLIHSKAVKTGKVKQVYSIILLNKRISLFDFKPFKNKRSEDKNITYNPLLPFRFVKEKQYELRITDEIYSEGEALVKAELLAEQKMKQKLSDDGESIISKRPLKYYQENNKIYLDVFFKVCEDISESKAIVPIDIEQQ